jgi:hypothetical protein
MDRQSFRFRDFIVKCKNSLNHRNPNFRFDFQSSKLIPAVGREWDESEVAQVNLHFVKLHYMKLHFMNLRFQQILRLLNLQLRRQRCSRLVRFSNKKNISRDTRKNKFTTLA